MHTELKELVDKLHLALSQRVGGQNANLPELIKEISRSNNPESVIYLLSCLLLSDKIIVESAADSIAQLFSKMNSLDFIRIDERVRSRILSGNYRSAWDKQGQELVPLMRNFEPQAVFMGLASMHQNGHVRELSLGALDLITDGSEIPYLLLRVTDWVASVSQKAKAALKKRLYPEYAGRFLASITLVDALRQRKRGNGAELFQSIHNLAAQAQLSDFLRELESPNQRARRLCFYMGLGTNLAARIEIIKRSLRNSDHLVRRMALLSSIAHLSKEELSPIFQSALADPFPSNRIETLRLVLSQYPESAEDELKKALLDRSPSVRAFARFHLKELKPNYDFAQFYREHLNNPKQQEVIASLASLAEIGHKTDYETIEFFLKHQNDQIAKAAIGALVTLDKERSINHLFDLLLHESSSISSAARKGLAKCCRYLQGEDLWRLYSSNRNAKIKYDILRIIGSLTKWERLGYCLLACNSADESIKKLALEYLERWQATYRNNWRFTSPTKIQTERIKLAAPIVSSIIAGRKFKDLHLVIDSL